MEENQGPLPSSKHSHTNFFQKAVVQKFLRPHNELLPLQTHLLKDNTKSPQSAYSRR